MKKLLVVLVLVMNVSAFASETSPITKKEIRTKIVKLLGDSNLNLSKSIETTVDLLVNKKGEIVILDIKSKNTELKNYIKSRLNYKKVVTNLDSDMKIYKMPLKIIK